MPNAYFQHRLFTSFSPIYFLLFFYSQFCFFRFSYHSRSKYIPSSCCLLFILSILTTLSLFSIDFFSLFCFFFLNYSYYYYYDCYWLEFVNCTNCCCNNLYVVCESAHYSNLYEMTFVSFPSIDFNVF